MTPEREAQARRLAARPNANVPHAQSLLGELLDALDAERAEKAALVEAVQDASEALGRFALVSTPNAATIAYLRGVLHDALPPEARP